MISDVTVIIYTPALTVTVTDLSDLVLFIMQRDFPDLFMPETKLTIRCTDMDRNQVDHAVGIFRSVVSEKHICYTSWILT